MMPFAGVESLGTLMSSALSLSGGRGSRRSLWEASKTRAEVKGAFRGQGCGRAAHGSARFCLSQRKIRALYRFWCF